MKLPQIAIAKRAVQAVQYYPVLSPLSVSRSGNRVCTLMLETCTLKSSNLATNPQTQKYIAQLQNIQPPSNPLNSECRKKGSLVVCASRLGTVLCLSLKNGMASINIPGLSRNSNLSINHDDPSCLASAMWQLCFAVLCSQET